MSKSEHWYVLYQGEVYANNLDFYKPLNEQEVREYLREIHDTKRLSNGIQIWKA